MVAVRKIQTVYYEDGDALWLHILPRQSAREAMTDHDFYVRYDSQEQEEIVGFRILDFSHFIVHLYEPGVVPQVDMRFDVVGSEIRNVTLPGLLEWAYRKYVLKEQEVEPVVLERWQQPIKALPAG